MNFLNLEMAIITLLQVKSLLNSQLTYLEETDLARKAATQLECFGPLPLHLVTSGLLITFLRRLSNCELSEEEVKATYSSCAVASRWRAALAAADRFKSPPAAGEGRKRSRLRSERVGWC